VKTLEALVLFPSLFCAEKQKVIEKKRFLKKEQKRCRAHTSAWLSRSKSKQKSFENLSFFHLCFENSLENRKPLANEKKTFIT
jgi:hypothetical protein